jgi:hypothetical protein
MIETIASVRAPRLTLLVGREDVLDELDVDEWHFSSSC